jgi:hypothetical protein
MEAGSPDKLDMRNTRVGTYLIHSIQVLVVLLTVIYLSLNTCNYLVIISYVLVYPSKSC